MYLVIDLVLDNEPVWCDDTDDVIGYFDDIDYGLDLNYENYLIQKWHGGELVYSVRADRWMKENEA